MSESITLTYNDADFRAQFTYFANSTVYPEALLSMYFDMGSNWVSPLNIGSMTGAARQLALYQMTAHLTQLFSLISSNEGAAPNIETEAAIDKVRVTVQPPKSQSQFQQWLSQTPFGQQLLSLLLLKSTGGFFIGGNPERLAFRRVGGGFG